MPMMSILLCLLFIITKLLIIITKESEKQIYPNK